MTNQHILLCLIFDRLDRVDHTNILALLEGDFGELKFNKLKALLAKNFKELLREAIRDARHLDGFFVLVASQVLEEVT